MWLQSGNYIGVGQGRKTAVVWVRISGGLSRRGAGEKGREETYLGKCFTT